MDKNLRFATIAEMSLSEATKPLLVASRLVGMNPKSHWHKIYTVCLLVCEVSVVCYIWQYYGHLTLKNYYFKILVHGMEDVCRITSLLVILGPSLFDQHRYRVPLNDFTSIDASLKSLSGYIDNRGTYRFQIVLVVYVGLNILLYGLMKLRYYLLLPTSDTELLRVTVTGWLHYLIVMLVTVVADCSFSSTLSIIRRRFKEINLIIHRILVHGSYLRINFLQICRTRTDNYLARDLRILRKQYHNLWGIANRVNEAYGPHLLIGAATSLWLITSNLWHSYYTFVSPAKSNPYDGQVTIECVIWALIYIARMLFLIKASESTVAEAKLVSIMLEELEIMKGDHDRATNSEIRNFLTQLQLEVPKFTACGFFVIDFTLICSILGAASTYLVILIQMDY